jgi:hypothetical protein
MSTVGRRSAGQPNPSHSKERYLRRKLVVVITGFAMLVFATAANAAINNYSGSGLKFSKGVGTKANPVGVSHIETLAAKNTDPTKTAAPLTHVTFKIYGLASNAKLFPTCSAARISAMKSDKFCPPKSKFASGSTNALLGDSSLSPASRVVCHPGLDVFNGGGNKLVFFFFTNATLQCGGLTTGVTPPYFGTVKQVGKYEIIDIPLPPSISTRVANQPGFYSSLIHQQLTWYKLSKKVKGKTVYNSVSVGCQKRKRPWSITLTALGDKAQTVNGSSPC